MQTWSTKVPRLRYCCWSLQGEGLQLTQRSLVISALPLVCATNHSTCNEGEKKWEPLLSDDQEELYYKTPPPEKQSTAHSFLPLLGPAERSIACSFPGCPLLCVQGGNTSVSLSLFSPICKSGILFPVPTVILWAIKLENIHTQR